MDQLSQYIDNYRKQIASLEDDLRIARLKLLGMEELYAATQQSKDVMKSVVLDAQTAELLNPPTSIAPTKRLNLNRRRALSPVWKAFLVFIGERGVATLNDITSVDPKIERKLIRSQLSYYARHGLVLKDELTLKYSLTDEGRVACGIPAPAPALDVPDDALDLF
jgi:hypothetical protein